MWVESNTETRSSKRFGEGKHQCLLCVVELHVTVNCIKIVSVAQQCLYGKCMSQAKMRNIRTISE